MAISTESKYQITINNLDGDLDEVEYLIKHLYLWSPDLFGGELGNEVEQKPSVSGGLITGSGTRQVGGIELAGNTALHFDSVNPTAIMYDIKRLFYLLDKYARDDMYIDIESTVEAAVANDSFDGDLSKWAAANYGTWTIDASNLKAVSDGLHHCTKQFTDYTIPDDDIFCIVLRIKTSNIANTKPGIHFQGETFYWDGTSKHTMTVNGDADVQPGMTNATWQRWIIEMFPDRTFNWYVDGTWIGKGTATGDDNFYCYMVHTTDAGEEVRYDSLNIYLSTAAAYYSETVRRLFVVPTDMKYLPSEGVEYTVGDVRLDFETLDPDFYDATQATDTDSEAAGTASPTVDTGKYATQRGVIKVENKDATDIVTITAIETTTSETWTVSLTLADSGDYIEVDHNAGTAIKNLGASDINIIDKFAGSFFEFPADSTTVDVTVATGDTYDATLSIWTKVI